MKKINIILTLSLVSLLTSCIIESYERPQRTIVGLEITSKATSSLATNASISDLARVAQMWHSAASEQEKYNIEDNYFRNNKIREIGDTIYVINLCKINTFGQSFTDSYWEVIMNHEAKRKVSLMSENKIRVESMVEDDVCDLTVECVGAGKEFLITGNGAVKREPYYPMAFSKMTYSIASPVRFIAPDVIHSPFSWSVGVFGITSGTIQTTPYDGTAPIDLDKTTAVFYSDNRVEIQFRGHRDIYNNMYWSPIFYK